VPVPAGSSVLSAAPVGVSSGGVWLAVGHGAAGSAVRNASVCVPFSSRRWVISRGEAGCFPCAIAQVILKLIVIKDCYSFITCHSGIT